MRIHGLSDALWCEFRPDRNAHWPATLIAANGSLCCCDDYELCGVMAKHIVKQAA